MFEGGRGYDGYRSVGGFGDELEVEDADHSGVDESEQLLESCGGRCTAGKLDGNVFDRTELVLVGHRLLLALRGLRFFQSRYFVGHAPRPE